MPTRVCLQVPATDLRKTAKAGEFGADEIRHAHEFLVALASVSARGSGAVALDGRMFDEALAVSARRAPEKALL